MEAAYRSRETGGKDFTRSSSQSLKQCSQHAKGHHYTLAHIIHSKNESQLSSMPEQD
jgi:hypothetical protein